MEEKHKQDNEVLIMLDKLDSKYESLIDEIWGSQTISGDNQETREEAKEKDTKHRVGRVNEEEEEEVFVQETTLKDVAQSQKRNVTTPMPIYVDLE